MKLAARVYAKSRRSLTREPSVGGVRLTSSMLPLVGCVLLALGCASSGVMRPLSKLLPLGVPSAALRAAWERIDGDYETATEHVRYSLFVDPERPLLFRITQFRVSPRRPGSGSRPRFEDGAEMVLWNEVPGGRVPLLCFAEERSGRTASRDAQLSWRNVSPMTPEFVASMLRAMEIYSQVHREGRAGPPVG